MLLILEVLRYPNRLQTPDLWSCCGASSALCYWSSLAQDQNRGQHQNRGGPLWVPSTRDGDPRLAEQVGGLMQERCNSIANALELHLSCTNPFMCWTWMMVYLILYWNGNGMKSWTWRPFRFSSALLSLYVHYSDITWASQHLISPVGIWYALLSNSTVQELFWLTTKTMSKLFYCTLWGESTSDHWSPLTKGPKYRMHCDFIMSQDVIFHQCWRKLIFSLYIDLIKCWSDENFRYVLIKYLQNSHMIGGHHNSMWNLEMKPGKVSSSKIIFCNFLWVLAWWRTVLAWWRTNI